MVTVIIVSFSLTGGVLMIDGCGLSDPRAIAAKVSIIKFNHKSCTTPKVAVPFVTAPMKIIIKAVKLAVNWN